MAFASRAGEKLEFALQAFNISPQGKIACDFGSSTGGFVDCLLQSGAKKVYSVDTSYGELAWKLRTDPRVVVLERTNAMHVSLPEKVDLITVDTAWTKQEKVIANALRNLKSDGIIISLIKPHYELGVARPDDCQIAQALEKVKNDVASMDGKVEKMLASPITGKRAENKEYLALILGQVLPRQD